MVISFFAGHLSNILMIFTEEETGEDKMVQDCSALAPTTWSQGEMYSKCNEEKGVVDTILFGGLNLNTK